MAETRKFSSIYNGVWIGLFDSNRKQNWTWSDGSSIDYMNWMDAQPDNRGHTQFCATTMPDECGCALDRGVYHQVSLSP